MYEKLFKRSAHSASPIWKLGGLEGYEAQMFGEVRSPRCLERLKGLQAKWVLERLRRGALGVFWGENG